MCMHLLRQVCKPMSIQVVATCISICLSMHMCVDICMRMESRCDDLLAQLATRDLVDSKQQATAHRGAQGTVSEEMAQAHV